MFAAVTRFQPTVMPIRLVAGWLVGALFLGEFAYRRVRFRNYRHHSPLQLLRNVRRTKLFER